MRERLHSYTVHTLAGDENEPVFVKEGFSLFGFLLGGFWLLYHRAWGAGVLALAIGGALEGATHTGQLSELTSGVLQLLLAVLIGLEGQELRREALARRGYALTDIVRDLSLARAELRYHERAHKAA